MSRWKRTCIVVALGLLPACGDGGSDEGASADDDASTGSTAEESTDTEAETDTQTGGMCEGSSTTADCASYCASVLAAACPDGPATPQECEQGCEMLNAAIAQCPAWGALVDCAESAPTFSCFMGETVPDGCEQEYYCMSLCFD